MRNRQITRTILAAAVLGAAAVSSQAQRAGGGVAAGTGFQGQNIIPGAGTVPAGNGFAGMTNVGQNTGFGFNGFNSQFGFGSMAQGNAFGMAYQPFAPLYGGYGGGYGYGPTITVTPNGNVQELGQGYNGNTGSGLAPNADWETMRALYAQAYQDGLNAAAANVAPNAPTTEPDYPTGMTATPRSASPSRVPHGDDTVKMWRVGRGQVVLRWQGDPVNVSSVTFEITDKSGRGLRRTTINQLPAEVRFTPPADAVFYQVNVQYIDGAKNTIMSRLPK